MAEPIFRRAQPPDIDNLFSLFREAQAWHRAVDVSAWPDFSREMVEDDIAAGSVFVLDCNGRVVATATVFEEDPLVWSDGKPSLYLHRLATARDLKGNGLCARIVAEIETAGQQQHKEALRLDCWADNEKLKSFYMSLGFTWLDDKFVAEDPKLPAHYWNSTTSLFEKEIGPVGAGDTLTRSTESLVGGFHGK